MGEKLDLGKIRTDIDRIDEEIAHLFEERMETVNKVAEYKKANNLPVRDEAREAVVLGKCKQRVQNSAYADGLRKIMAQIMDISVDQEKKLLAETKARKSVIWSQGTVVPVGYQGVAGAYSYLAVKKYFAKADISISNYMLFEDVTKAVREGKIKYGVLPIENSSTGGITEVYDLIRQYNCYIIGEQCIKVEHNLMAWPGTKLENITEVYSHPQGFSQCRPFFRQYPKMQQIPYFNTAKGAELVSKEKTNYMAAVTSKEAASIYGLEILAAGINANTNNYTRFFIIAAEPVKSKEANKITMVVALKHEPGSLYRLLSYFQAGGLNLLNIESRPIEGKSWEYFFHIDVSGNLEESPVQEALEKIKKEATECKILGNYIADKI
ncbi:MAG: prephenate dehydratase [Acidaminococcaceae bacterium]